ncbi:response regulator [Tellurirhabdus rosea]|uniref:response regulator n=1 Tax=Tellurirhabdus rosea TaxID=2674997 RepID=UPI002255A4E3|nr:response regulator [Tellurirhabdus rosea]
MVDLLYVEDNPNDVAVFNRAISKLDVGVRYVVVETGKTAIDYLTDPQTKDSARLVLLDLNLPDLSGLQVLEELRTVARLRRLPIVIYSTSDEPREVQRAYELGANAYIRKPSNYKGVGSVLSRLCGFWLMDDLLVH